MVRQPNKQTEQETRRSGLSRFLSDFTVQLAVGIALLLISTFVIPNLPFWSRPPQETTPAAVSDHPSEAPPRGGELLGEAPTAPAQAGGLADKGPAQEARPQASATDLGEPDLTPVATEDERISAGRSLAARKLGLLNMPGGRTPPQVAQPATTTAVGDDAEPHQGVLPDSGAVQSATASPPGGDDEAKDFPGGVQVVVGDDMGPNPDAGPEEAGGRRNPEPVEGSPAIVTSISYIDGSTVFRNEFEDIAADHHQSIPQGHVLRILREGKDRLHVQWMDSREDTWEGWVPKAWIKR